VSPSSACAYIKHQWNAALMTGLKWVLLAGESNSPLGHCPLCSAMHACAPLRTHHFALSLCSVPDWKRQQPSLPQCTVCWGTWAARGLPRRGQATRAAGRPGPGTTGCAGRGSAHALVPALAPAATADRGPPVAAPAAVATRPARRTLPQGVH